MTTSEATMPPVTKDHYQTLGIKRGAAEKEIKSAFRNLARKNHPDTNQGDPAAEERFKDINEAYEVLSDAADRRLYDRYGDDWRAYRDAGFDGTEPQQPPRSNSRTGTYSTGGSAHFSQQFTDDDFGSLFGSMFNRGEGASATFQRRASKGQDIEQRVEVTFDEAFHGTQ